jgi:hypothetical protein
MRKHSRFGWRLVVPLVAGLAILFGSANIATAAPGKATQASAQGATVLAPRLVSIVQSSSNRFLDAHEIASLDFNVVTRPFQNNLTQQWVLTDIGNGIFTIVQASNGRFLDAHEYSAVDFRVVTRPNQNNATQAWLLINVGGLFEIQQVSSGRFLDAYETSSKDFQVVTRGRKNAAQQRWRIIDV